MNGAVIGGQIWDRHVLTAFEQVSDGLGSDGFAVIAIREYTTETTTPAELIYPFGGIPDGGFKEGFPVHFRGRYCCVWNWHAHGRE